MSDLALYIITQHYIICFFTSIVLYIVLKLSFNSIKLFYCVTTISLIYLLVIINTQFFMKSTIIYIIGLIILLYISTGLSELYTSKHNKSAVITILIAMLISIGTILFIGAIS
jgi:hypothetical protein